MLKGVRENPVTPNNDPLLTVKQVARILNISESTAYKWIDEGRIPYVDFGIDRKRRCIRVRQETLKELIEKNSIQNSREF